MVLYYCNKDCQIQLKKKVYQFVLENIKLYDLDEERSGILKSQKLNGIRIAFDPLEVVEDPATLYKGLLIHNGLGFKLGWMSNTIEDILSRPLLIGESQDHKTEVRNSALDVVGKISHRIIEESLTESPLKLLMDQYYNRIFSNDYTIEKLDIHLVDAYCTSISIETVNYFKDVSKGNKEPATKRILVFHLNIHKLSDVPLVTFKWNQTVNKLSQLFEYLISKGFIAPETAFCDFQIVFQEESIETIKNKLIWKDLGKNRKPTSGLIVDFIHRLSEHNFIDKKFLEPRHRNPVIEACFILPDGTTPRVFDKRPNPSWILRPILYHLFQCIVYQRFSPKFTT